jgi:hypothetical protein
MEVIGLEYGGPAERSGKVRVGDCKKIKVNQRIIYGMYRYIAIGMNVNFGVILQI